MHLGALCMQLRAPVSFYSLWEGQKWGLFHLIDKIADFLHNELFFSGNPEGFAFLLGQGTALRSLVQPCAVNNTFFSLWECPKMGFLPKERTYRAFFVLLHKRNVFRMVPEGLNAFGTFVHAAESAN